MALVFIPTLGAIFGKPSITSKKRNKKNECYRKW